MKQTFEKDLFERANLTHKTLSPNSSKTKNPLLRVQDLNLHPSFSAQHSPKNNPKGPQPVGNLDLRTTLSHDINVQSPPSKEKFSQRDILLKIPVDLYNKDQIWDAVHIFQSPRDKLKMIDLVLERRNQINERKKRKKLAKAMTLLPEVTGLVDGDYVEPEPLYVVNKFRRTLCEIDVQQEDEQGIQPAHKAAKKKFRAANTQAALEIHDLSDSDSSESSTDSVKLVFPMNEKEDRLKSLQRRGSILQVRMSGTANLNILKFGELNPIAEAVTPKRFSIHDLNAEKRRSIMPKEDQSLNNPFALINPSPEMPFVQRRKSSFNQLIKLKEDSGNGQSHEGPHVLRRKSSFNQGIKPKEDFVVNNQNTEIPRLSPILKGKGSPNQVTKLKEEPGVVNGQVGAQNIEMPAILRRKNSMNLNLSAKPSKDEVATVQHNNEGSPPALRIRSSVNLAMEGHVAAKGGSAIENNNQPGQAQKKDEMGSSPLIYNPKKAGSKSVIASDIIKIQKNEPNDIAYSIAGKKFERDLSKFLLMNKDHSVTQLILKQSSTMSPRMKQIQHHIKSQFEEVTGVVKPQKLPNLSLSQRNIKVDKGIKDTLGGSSPKKLSQIFLKSSADFSKEMKRNRSIQQKSVSLRIISDQQIIEAETEETPVASKRVMVKKNKMFQEIFTPKAEKKGFDRSPRIVKSVRGVGSFDYSVESLKKASWKEEFKRSVKGSP